MRKNFLCYDSGNRGRFWSADSPFVSYEPDSKSHTFQNRTCNTVFNFCADYLVRDCLFDVGKEEKERNHINEIRYYTKAMLDLELCIKLLVSYKTLIPFRNFIIRNKSFDCHVKVVFFSEGGDCFHHGACVV